MVNTMPIIVIHFRELLLKVIFITYIDASNNDRLTQYRGDTWLKTTSYTESIDRG
jgi:hypothetical protein